ncbi:5429_t:CDS:2 [Entrophospora sp. SA101]|nr:5429_t:CDS:2 [Entrophospora sp. SA101]
MFTNRASSLLLQSRPLGDELEIRDFYLPIQDLKNCCSLNDIWKTEVIREIRKRLIVDCTFVNRKTTVKALIDPKSKYGSISKALAQKMGLYITRMYGSKYPAVEDLGIGATNAGKKVMRRGWVDREKVSVTLPNIFELGKLKSLPRYLNETFTNFVVIDKPEYDLVLGSSWLTGRGIDIDFYGYKICRNELWEKKGKCYWREDSIEILPRSLHIFYEMLFPKLIRIDRDGDIILTCFSDKNMKNSLIDLNDSAKSSKKKTVPSRLAKEDITAIVFAEQLKAGIKKVNAHYHIGPTTIKKIWASSNPYEHANSIGEPNLPEWYNKNVKFKESSPNASQEIVLPEETKLLVKEPNIVKQDTSEKRKKKEAEMERIAKRIIRSELGRIIQAED